jgi:N-acetylneuraminate synthase
LSRKRTLIIAEAGVNHNGSVEAALDLVDIAADSGADVVKFQTFDVHALASAAAPQAAYQRERAAAGSQLEMLEALQIDRVGHDRIAERCEARGIEFLSTAFDERSLMWLSDLGIKRVKVPSGELTNGPLLLCFARTGLPLIVSTGMASLADIESALAVIAYGLEEPEGVPTRESLRAAYARAAREGSLRHRVALLHCTSSYPAEPADVNLAAMGTLKRAFGVPVGYSDHTMGTAVSIAAVARGASIIEKHFTTDRSKPGPDHAASLEPEQLADLVAAIRVVDEALGSPVKFPTDDEVETMAVARRSVVAARSIEEGEMLDERSLTTLRPGTGRSPMDIWELVGRTVRRSYAKHDLIDPTE